MTQQLEQKQRAVAPPPQLHFDDGSRIIAQVENYEEEGMASSSDRGEMDIHVYYEIDRLSREVLNIMNTKKGDSDFFRVALQFPDNLLHDAPDVCWAMENALGESAFVFILGDTTFGACCPDEVSALHLDASVLIHYGHACLVPSFQLPVLYSFGISSMDIEACVEAVNKQIISSCSEEDSTKSMNFLLLYQVQYHHAIEEIKSKIYDRKDESITISIVKGEIPPFQAPLSEAEEIENEENNTFTPKKRKVAGLEIPSDLDFSNIIVLYIGDPSSNNRQYVNMMMQLVSETPSPDGYWTYNPTTQDLECVPNRIVRRQLNRRFYLIQKARDATTFGILVGTLSQRHFTRAVKYLQKIITAADRACYTFAVGKLNPAKLANFGEIDAYVLVACPEHSLLSNDREFHVPVITPLELDICLGNTEWGAYSLDYNDFLDLVKDRTNNDEPKVENDDEDNSDAPYFSLVTGTLQDSRKLSCSSQAVDLQALPGQGQLIAHHSAGAEYLKRREFQGLETQLGQTEVHAAREGQKGIASQYEL